MKSLRSEPGNAQPTIHEILDSDSYEDGGLESDPTSHHVTATKITLSPPQ